MDILQNILLKKKDKLNQKQQDFTPRKYNRKKRSQSLQTIFRLPKSMLDKFRAYEQISPIKRQRSSNQKLQQTIYLGNIGQQYHHNLRKTILNQTKQILNFTKPHNGIHRQNNFIMKSEIGYHSLTPSNKNGFNTQYEMNIKTLNILQKAIIKEDDLFQFNQNLFELQVNRLPIIRKRESKRKQLLETFQFKRAELSPTQKQHLRNIPITNLVKNKEEKPDIRGWDTPQLIEL